MIADSKELILILAPDGSVQDEVPIPGEQQEGLAFDDSGTLWIADDKDKSVLKVPGALAALEARVGVASVGPMPRTPKEILEEEKSELLN